MKTLIFKDRPYFTNSFSELGIAISILGVFSGLILGWYKVFIANALNSSLVYADAISSLCAGFASLLALFIAGDHSLVWWADAGTGSIVAAYTLYQGYNTINKSKVSSKNLLLCFIIFHNISLKYLLYNIHFPIILLRINWNLFGWKKVTLIENTKTYLWQ